MKDKRILYVSSELVPYLPENDISKIAFDLPKAMHSQGVQIRMFMPRFGVINERRHQLHEVIRLSGMNLIINDLDMPLIIKVASIPKERMQVYFIDNEDYFKRKAVLKDEEGKLFEDNDERAIFFAKGVVETVKKLKWAPDIIHVHGWLASLVPLYIRSYYKNDPLFNESKIVTSVYNESFDKFVNKENLLDKIKFDNIDMDQLEVLKEAGENCMMKLAIMNSDAVIKGNKDLPEELNTKIDSLNIPVLEHEHNENLSELYSNFYLNEVLQ
jgi:starch synthase